MPADLVSKLRPTRRKAKPVLQGQKSPLQPEALSLIRASLKAGGDIRGLALLNVGVDSMLRSSDLLALRVSDVLASDMSQSITPRVTIMQGKTRRAVTFSLSPNAIEAIRALIEAESKHFDDYLFTSSRDPHGKHLTPAMFRRLVKSWAKIARLDPRRFSGHSLRRTRAAYVYARTRNVVAVQRALGHSSPANTVLYLGLDTSAALDIVDKFVI